MGAHNAASGDRRRREALLRGDRQGHSGRVHPRIRRRLSLVGTAGALLRALLPLHHGERARLSALRRTEGRREVFAGARARRHPRGARCAQDRQGACRRPLDGRLCDVAFRLHLSGARPFAGHRGLRLRRRAGQARAVRGGSGSFRQALRGADHGEGRGSLCAWADAGAAPEPRPARLARIRRPVRRAFDRRRGADHARRAGEAPLAVRAHRQDEGDHRADLDHDRRRGLALHRAGRADEEEYRHRRAGGDAERRPQHQPGRPGGVQRASRRAVRRRRCRHLAHARSARDGGIDFGEVGWRDACRGAAMPLLTRRVFLLGLAALPVTASPAAARRACICAAAPVDRAADRTRRRRSRRVPERIDVHLARLDGHALSGEHPDRRATAQGGFRRSRRRVRLRDVLRGRACRGACARSRRIRGVLAPHPLRARRGQMGRAESLLRRLDPAGGGERDLPAGRDRACGDNREDRQLAKSGQAPCVADRHPARDARGRQDPAGRR